MTGESSEQDRLIALAQGGDLSAFEQLVALHQERVYGLALRMMRSEADAAEVMQDAFLAAWRNLKDLKVANEAGFAGWLSRISANHALMKLRHRKVARQVEGSLEQPEFNERGSLADDVADWSRDALGQTLDAELARAIEQASDALPETHRQVFLLKDMEGLSYEEISEITGESVPAVKSRLHRARLAMRAAIDRFYADVESSA